MVELRWNPIYEEWVIVASHRKNRPNLPSKKQCPFCPDAEELKNLGDWKYLSLPNKFPSLMESPPLPEVEGNELFKVKPALGECEVILYTPKHHERLELLSDSHVLGLISFWADRFIKIGKKTHIKYVLIFENRGRDVGVSLDHPHGQIYSFSFIPTNILRELKSSAEFKKNKKKCLFCSIIEKEINFGKRIVIENDCFVCFIPFYATWPFGPHIYSKRHLQSLADLNENEKLKLAIMLKKLLNKLNKIFDGKHSFQMILHQEPTDGKDHSYYHFHIEFYVINRAINKLKYLGGCELGSGTFVNPIAPEEAAEILRNA
ncbi:MAG: galactose-1-phosphate uridylyltransferase [Candidatus Helarchaeota archaeon]